MTFAYLGGGLTEERHTADEAWMAEARRHLSALVDGVREGRFQPTPGEHCGSCDFLHFCGPGKEWLAR